MGPDRTSIGARRPSPQHQPLPQQCGGAQRRTGEAETATDNRLRRASPGTSRQPPRPPHLSPRRVLQEGGQGLFARGESGPNTCCFHPSEELPPLRAEPLTACPQPPPPGKAAAQAVGLQDGGGGRFGVSPWGAVGKMGIGQ
ncbi:unnamed protein product [Boreogadus saida]